MPNPRLPTGKAKVTGADVLHPKRHSTRSEPTTSPLAGPSPFLDGHGEAAWEGFRRELPWLMESDRAAVEICAQVRGLLMAGEDVGVTKLSMYQSILSKLGATPADRTRVSVPEGEEHDEFFDN